MNNKSMILIVLMVSMMGGHGTPYLHAQNGYTITLSDTQINITYNQSTVFFIHLTNTSGDVPDAWFSIDEPFFDIEESQTYLGNGNYSITVTQSVSTRIRGGNYTTTLITNTPNQILETSIDIVVSNPDTIAPSLVIISPEVKDGFNETVFKVEINGSDNIKWRRFEVTLGDTILFEVENLLESLERNNLVYNRTHIRVNQWIDLTNIEATGANSITISLTDYAANTNSTTFTLVGDYTQPSVSFTSHENNQRIYSLDITLTWEVIDVSNITRQLLYYNDRILSIVSLAPTDRTVQFNLPIKSDEPATLSFKLLVYDRFDNRGEVEINLIYDIQSQIVEQNVVEQLFNSEDTQMVANIIAGIILVIIVAAVAVILGKKIKNREIVEKLDKKYLKISTYTNILNDMNLDTDIRSNIEQELEDMLNTFETSNQSDAIQTKIIEILIANSVDNEALKKFEEEFKKV